MQQYELLVDDSKINDNLEPWQTLDNVIRSWAVLTAHEKTQEDYENLKNQHG